MTTTLTATSERKLTLHEVIAKYSRIPRLLILRIDAQIRGVHYTDQALSIVDPSIHQIYSRARHGIKDDESKQYPASLLLKDGSLIISSQTPLEKNPYLVDLVDGRLALVDNDEIIEFVELWEKPAYYELYTSSGIPMKDVVSARPQRLDLSSSTYCHFGAKHKGCKFCAIYPPDRKSVAARVKPQDITETIRAAISEPGRFSFIHITGGTKLGGKELLDAELEHYIETLQAIGENFATKKFPCDVTTTAFSEKQLHRLYDETGIMAYTTDLEVLNEEKFNWICPGKSETIGYKEWKKRLVTAVGIFGRGYVGTGIVAGVELAKPFGFTSEDEALRSTLAEAEDLAANGVTTWGTVWKVLPGAEFRDQQGPSLEYCVRLAEGLYQLRVKYDLKVDFNDYRRCGNHPDADLSRLLK
jgi:hypothetical protein